MKSSEILGWIAMVNVSLLTACGGVSSIGSGTGSGGAGSPGMGTAGSRTAGSPGMGVDPEGGRGGTTGMLGAGMGGKLSGAMAGSGAMASSAAMAGSGATSSLQPCRTDEECPGAGEPCQMCTDGTLACNMGYCDGASGICKRNGGFCSPKCGTAMDCPIPDLACTDCGDGSEACPAAECRVGFCELSYPGCGDFDPCAGLKCGHLCNSCPTDSTCDSSVLSFCNNAGKCQPGPPSCNQNKCQTSMDCGTPPPICTPCVDGSCAGFDCVNNKCAWNCPTSSLQCKYTDECLGFFDGQCTMCPTGKCAVPACIQNSCELVCPVK
jgi:hypothetical protein